MTVLIPGWPFMAAKEANDLTSLRVKLYCFRAGDGFKIKVGTVFLVAEDIKFSFF
jgi:hypothetical protein